MFWEAIDRNGKMHKEILGERFENMDPTQIVALTLREQPTAHSLPMDLEANYLQFVNMNQLKIANRKMPDLILHFDTDRGVYAFSKNSLDFLRDVIIEEEAFYPSFGVDNWKFHIDNQPMNFQYMIKVNKEYVNLFEMPHTGDRISFICDAHTDIVSGAKSQKKFSVVDAATLRCETTFSYEDVTFKTNLKLEYIPDIRRLVLHLFLYTSKGGLPTSVSFKTPSRDFEFKSTIGDTCSAGTKMNIYTFNE